MSVRITGFQKPGQVVSYLNAANVAVVGSYVEGWSASMLEALACGKPIVSTEVSGAKAMVIEGRNGFIVNNRDPVRFSEAMQKALQLPEAERVSRSIAAEYDLEQFGKRLTLLFPPLGGTGAGREIEHPKWTSPNQAAAYVTASKATH